MSYIITLSYSYFLCVVCSSDCRFFLFALLSASSSLLAFGFSSVSLFFHSSAIITSLSIFAFLPASNQYTQLLFFCRLFPPMSRKKNAVHQCNEGILPTVSSTHFLRWRSLAFRLAGFLLFSLTRWRPPANLDPIRDNLLLGPRCCNQCFVSLSHQQTCTLPN